MKNTSITLLINKLLGKPSTKYEKFHTSTRIKKFQKEHTGPMPSSWTVISYKAYPRLPQIILPPPQAISASLIDILQQRNSSRIFGEKPLSLEKISTLLSYATGIKKKEKRYYPSAGARFPLETYIILLRSDLPKGLYHYNVKLHALELLMSLPNFKLEKYTNLDWVKDAGCLFLITAIFKRTTQKYGERGYRHVLQEAGAVNQNIYLLSTALALNTCAIGAYKDAMLHTLLDIDGLEEAIVSVLVCGEKL